jgi:hypothetical protein
VVSQVLPNRQRRVGEHVEVVVAGEPAVLELPGVTALETAVDQDAGAVELLVEVVG